MTPEIKASQQTFLYRFYYLFTALSVLNSGKAFNVFMGRQDSIFKTPIPAFAWTSHLGTELSAVMGYLFAVVISFYCAWRPWGRSQRIAHFLAMLGYVWWWFITQVSMKDFDKLMLIQVSFLLIFLPQSKAWKSEEGQKQSQTVLSAVQLNLLLIYSMSGLTKILTTLWGYKTGDGLLLPDGMVIRVITHTVGTYSGPELAPMAGTFASLREGSYPLTLGVVLLQTTAVWGWFRPKWMPYYGALIISMHIANSLLFNIHYFDHMVLLGVFLVISSTTLLKDSPGAEP